THGPRRRHTEPAKAISTCDAYGLNGSQQERKGPSTPRRRSLADIADEALATAHLRPTSPSSRAPGPPNPLNDDATCGSFISAPTTPK
ncbi:unnamed protein product, partial [Chrysoparadoxa australica]